MGFFIVRSMTRNSRYTQDYSDPASYSGSAWGLEARRAGVAARGPVGLVAQAVGAVFLAIFGLWLAWHVIGFLFGAVLLAVKIAVMVGIVALIVAAVRRFR